MLRDIDPLEAGEAPHPDIVKLREQKSVDEMPSIHGELRVIDRFLGDLEPRRARTQEPAAPPPIEFNLRLAGSRNEERQIEPEEVMALDYVGIALLDQGGQPLQSGALRLVRVGGIDDEQLFPAGVVGKRDAHQTLGRAGILNPGDGEDFQLQSAQFLKPEPLEKSAARMSQIMLHRIA